MTRKRSVFVAGAFFFFLAYFVLAYGDVIFRGMSFAKRDVLRYYYPMWQLAVEGWKNGQPLFWNPYHSLGKPFAANIQNCVFYPLQIILFLPDYTQAFNLYILIHLAMAGAFTALWMREYKVSTIASLAAGFAFATCGYMASAINLTISLCSIAYFPLALLCWRRALSEKGLGWRIGLAGTLVLQYLAGDPAVVFSTLVVLSTFTVYRTFEASLEARRLVLQPLGRFIFSGAAFLGLAAFHYPMFYQMLKQSTRSVLDYEWATMWSVQLNDLLGLVIPFFSDVSVFFMDYWVRQSWLDNYYAGICVVLLAVWAYPLRRDRVSGYHILLVLFGWSLALGRFSGVYWFFNKCFPFFGLIRYPVRFSYIAYFGMACLAGFAIDHIQKNKPALKPSRSFVPALVAIVAGFGIVCAGVVWARPLRQQSCVWAQSWLLTIHSSGWEKPLIEDMAIPLFENLRRTFFLAWITFTGITLYRMGKVGGGLIALFFAVLLAADLGTANNFELRIERQYMAKKGSHVEAVLKDPGLFRVFSAPSLFNTQNMPLEKDIPSAQNMLMQTFAPNFLAPLHIQDIMGYDSLFLENSAYVTDARFFVKDPAHARYFNMMNAKYVVSPKPDMVLPFERVDHSDKTTLYRDTRVLPRAFLVRRAQVEPDRKKTINYLTSEKFDPTDILYLDQDPGWLGPDPVEGEGAVEVTRYTPDAVEMHVQSPGERWLFFSDAWYPAWRAWIDGKPVPILRANIAFRAVKIGPGEHRVLWKYDTLLFRMGLAVSLLTAVGLAIGARRASHGH